MQIATLVLFVACLIGYIWLATVMFKRHYLWGSLFVFPSILGFVAGFIGSESLFIAGNVLGLLAFLLAIVFAIKNWSVAKKAFSFYLLASFALGGIIASEAIDMMESPEVVAILQQLEQGQLSEQQAQQSIQEVIQQKFIDRYTSVGSGTVTNVDDELLTPEEQRIEALRAELQIKNEAALASQAYAEEQAKKEEQVEEVLRKVKVFSPIKISEAKNYIGKKVRIVSFEGVERQGILISAGFDRLNLDRKLAGGRFKFDVLTKDIKVLEVQKIELR